MWHALAGMSRVLSGMSHVACVVWHVACGMWHVVKTEKQKASTTRYARAHREHSGFK
jgi:hypothetical protein